MIGRNIESARPVTVAEVKALLEEQKAGHELSFEQQTTLEYAQKVASTTSKNAQAMVKELMKMEKLTPEVACKLVDLLPVNKEQLLAVVSKERYTLNEKEVEQILAILQKAASTRRSHVAAVEKAAEEALAETAAAEKAAVEAAAAEPPAEAAGDEEAKKASGKKSEAKKAEAD
ncbi:RNA polymerase Rpb4 [Candidatus Burarchaeum australiense]|nr:RNA polymerase Rpb4 [Candidatus Burarchaeum australiense]